MRCTLAVLAAPLLLVAVAGQAHADTAGVSFVSPGSAMNNNIGFGLGYAFTANRTITVTALGYFDGGQLSEGHEVGLFQGDGTLLASAEIYGDGLQLGSFNYDAIAPVTLQAGQSYEVIGTSGLVDAYAFDTVGLDVDPAITYLHDAFSYGNTLQFADRSENIGADAGGAFFGANFLAASAVTPEPASWCLLTTGLAALCGSVRRRFAPCKGSSVDR